MRFPFASALALVVVLVAGCSGNEGEISLESASAGLTDGGNDELFTVAVVKTRDGGYGPDTFKVKVVPDGKDPLDVACAWQDVNMNKMLDAGDKLVCKEGPINSLGASLDGTTLSVELWATVGGLESRIGDVDWTPTK